MIFIGWLQWLFYWAITSIASRTIQVMYPESKLAIDLGWMH